MWSGDLDGEGVDGLEGFTRLSGQGLYEREDDAFRYVYWTLEVERQSLQVNGLSISGKSTFDVYGNLFETSFEYHDLAGTLNWDEDSHQLVYSAWFVANSNLQELSATHDQTTLEWETDNPDAP